LNVKSAELGDNAKAT